MSTFFIVGASKTFESIILEAAAHSLEFSVISLSQRPLLERIPKEVHKIVEKDVSNWPDIIRKNSNGAGPGSVILSTLDYLENTSSGAYTLTLLSDLEYACAREAYDAGYETFVALLSSNVDLKLWTGEKFHSRAVLEQKLCNLRFLRTIIMKLGKVIEKESSESSGSLSSEVSRWIHKYPTINVYLAQVVTSEEVAIALFKVLETPDEEGVRKVSSKEVTTMGCEK